MSAFAKSCGISQSVVWRDCHGRKVSNQRFSTYLSAFSRAGQERLLRARFHDIIPEDLRGWLRIEPPGAVGESPSTDDLALLPSPTRDALNRLAREMARDPELEDWVVKFIRKVC